MSKRKDRDDVDELVGAMDNIMIEHHHDPDDIVASMGAMSMTDRPSKRARGAPSTLNTSVSSSGFTRVNPKTKGNSNSSTFERKRLVEPDFQGVAQPSSLRMLGWMLSKDSGKHRTKISHGKGGPLSKIANLPIQKDASFELSNMMKGFNFS